MSDSQLDQDLAALRKVSARDIPDLETTLQSVRRREQKSRAGTWNIGRKIMAAFDSVRTRPALAAVALGVLVIAVSLVVPVSYDRVVGHDVALTLAGKNLDASELQAVARDFKSALGAGPVRVEAQGSDAGTHYVLHATSPRRAGAEVQRATAEFARGLAAKGYAASVQVAAHRERVRYPAMAYALDQIINISVDGKSAAELESEIRSRLAAAGVPDAQVSVTDRPEGGREVRMEMKREREGGSANTAPEPMPQVVLTKDGAPLQGAEGLAVKVQKKKDDSGAMAILVEVIQNGKTAKAEVPNAQSMPDAAIADAITTQLRQGGIEARVTVNAGQISVEPVK
jgi:hypothetical protein